MSPLITKICHFKTRKDSKDMHADIRIDSQNDDGFITKLEAQSASRGFADFVRTLAFCTVFRVP